MSTKHLGSFSGNRLDFDADLLTFPGRLHRLVIVFYASYHAQVNKLKNVKFRGYVKLAKVEMLIQLSDIIG